MLIYLVMKRFVYFGLKIRGLTFGCNCWGTIRINFLRNKCLWLLAVLGLLTFTIKAQSLNCLGSENRMKVGAASLKITPPIGSVMGNSYGLSISEGVHDDLFVKALVFDVEGEKGALIALDLISLPYGLVQQTRELVAAKTGIAKKNLIMTATHCHAGPQMNPRFLKNIGGEPERKSLAYLSQLPEKLVQAIQEAEGSLQPAKASIGYFNEDKVNFNRRFLMKDGSFKTNPGRLNPHIERAMGPVDPKGSVVLFESMDDSPIAVLVNFALHPAIVVGNKFSADFPGVVSKIMEGIYGEELVTVYTNGNSGNINHIDVKSDSKLDHYEESARIGTILAADVMKALTSLQPLELRSLKIAKRKVELPVPNIESHQVQWAKDILDRFGKADPPKFTDVVDAWRVLDLEKGKEAFNGRVQQTTTAPLNEEGDALLSEVQVFSFGSELALVGFPGDAFVELSLAIRIQSPYAHTIVFQQSGNGNLSYVPDRKAFLEGGYEVNSARFSPGGGELLVDAVQRLLISLFYN